MSATPPGDVTGLLIDWSNGDRGALERLTPRVYDELRRLAGGYLRRERPDHTLQATALVNEAFLRMVDQSRVEWRSRAHFTALAAQMMRRILIDHARSHAGAKRGGGSVRVSLDQVPEVGAGASPEVLAVDEALTALAREHPGLVGVVELRYFGGLTSEEIAEVLGISVPTVTRRWRLARAWLYRYLSNS